MDPSGRVLPLVAGLWIALLPELARAQSVPTTLDEGPQTARSLAMGGGMYGAASSTTSLFANPAGLAMAHVYHIDALGLWDGAASRWSVGGAIVDSSHSVAAGLAYNYSNFSDSASGRYTHDVRLALALPITEAIGIGLTGRYMDITGTSTSNGIPGQAFNGFTVDAGVMVRPIHALQLGVTGMSLTNPDTTVTPFSIAGGIGVFPIDALTINADMLYDMHSWVHPQGRFSGGIEYLISTVPVRLGYVYDEGRKTQAITGGLGWIDQAFAVEASLRQEVEGGHQSTILLNVRYFYRLL